MKSLTTIELIEEDGRTEVHWVGSPATAERLEHAIQELAQMRRDTSPPVALELQPNKPFKLEREVGVLVTKDHKGMPLMAFRHPGVGWIHFRLEPGLLGYLRNELGKL